MKDVFKEKYLEYEPKITLEIFTLVWNRLIELGYKSFARATIEERYDEFKGVCNYFRTTYDHPNEFNCYYDGNDYTKTTVEEILGYNPFIKDDYTKTTVEEILGYNPFIKDDFVLPKKWCIKIQANGIPYEVAQWRKSTWSDSGYMSSSGTWHCDNAIGYPEITFDQFKKYVLKETKPSKDWSKATDEELLEEAKRMYPIGCKVKLIRHNIGGDFKNEVRFTRHKFYTSGERKQLFIDGNLLIFDRDVWAEIESLSEVRVKNETKEAIPEYVECLENSSGFTIRKIYQTNNMSTKDWYKFDKDDLGRNNGWDKKFFKPSTKEAFDAQNKDEEKPQFIVGKWYKCKDYDYIIKYFGIKKSKNGDAILYSDLINCDKHYTYPEGETGVGYTTNKYWYELTDLYEIQQYLPDGHIDKIVKHVDKQVSKEPTRLSFYVKYCDEFTEDLLKSLMKWSQKNTTLKDRGRDNSFKGLKEDRYFLFDNFGLNRSKYGYGVDNNKQGCFQEYSIKEVKELIGYKESTKFIEKWSFGSYIVPLQNKLLSRSESLIKGKPYQIIKYTTVPYIISERGEEINFIDDDNTEKNEGIKWFATKSEAEEFAKTLVEPIKEEVKQAVHCTTKEEWDFFILKEVNKSYAMSKEPFQKDSAITFDNSWDRVDYLKNNDYQILSFQEWCDLNGYKMEKEFAKTLVEPIKKETKQPLKQAVHCKTQEEWDFVLSKFNPRGLTSDTFNQYKSNSIIILSEELRKLYYGSFSDKNKTSFKEILSFQEWCDLNGYKMKKELKQVAGVWYKWVKHRNVKDGLKYVKSNYFSENVLYYLEKINVGGTHVYTKSHCVWDEELVEVSLSEIQQYLPEGHPDKISSAKDTNILNESSIGKFISFKYSVGNKFYNKALIIKENGNIYLLNNCYSNNNGHKDKSIYKYSLKYRNFKEVELFCKEIKFLTTEEVPKLEQQVLTPDWEIVPKFNHQDLTPGYLDWEVVPKRVTKSNEIELIYLPEPN